jgi:hypothetical protein
MIRVFLEQPDGGIEGKRQTVFVHEFRWRAQDGSIVDEGLPVVTRATQRPG